MRLALLAASLLALASCGGDAPPPEADAPAGPEATAFITENAEPQAYDRIDETGIARDAAGRPFTYALLGETLPAFTGPMVGGGTFDSTALEGWTVIDVWGIWCSDCMADAPYVAALARAIDQDPDLAFISIHTPPSAARADEAFGRYGSVEAYFDARGIGYPTVIDTDAAIRDLLRVVWTPSYLLVAPDGRIVAFRTDLSAAGGEPVKDFLKDVAEVKRDNRAAEPRAALAIGPGGVGGLTAETVFARPALERAFPDHVVIADTGMTEGEAYPRFRIAAADAPDVALLHILPTWDRAHVHMAIARDPSVTGPAGEVIGETRLADVPEAERVTCLEGLEEDAERLICGRSEAADFYRVFAAPDGYDGYFPAAGPEVKADGVLVEMRYLPPRPVPADAGAGDGG